MEAGSSTPERVRRRIEAYVGYRAGTIKDDHRLRDLCDSIEVCGVRMELEEEFDIEIDDEDDNFVTVGDAIKYIQSRLSSPGDSMGQAER